MADPASLKSSAIRGSMWTVGSYGASMVLRLGGNLVLTRLLLPEAFGLMALTNVVIIGLSLFSDMGLGPSVIQNKRGDDPVFLNTAWTLQIARGGALWLVATLLAWPASRFYGEPRLVSLIPVSALSAVLAGFNSMSIQTAGRRVTLGRVSILNLATYALGAAVMVILALITKSVWALVIGGLVSSMAQLIGSHTLLPGIAHRPALDRESLSELWSFGRWVFLSTAVTFLAGQSDRLLLGHYVAASDLGVYSVAETLASAPSQIVNAVTTAVLFPVFSRLTREGAHRLVPAYYRARLVLHAGALFVGGGLLATGTSVVGLLYDPRYAAAGWMLQVLCVRLLVLSATAPSGACLLALGKVKYSFYGNLASAVWQAVGIPLGWNIAGLAGVVWIVGLSAVPRLIVGWIGMSREKVLLPSREFATWPIGLAGALFGFAVASVLQ